MGAIRVLNFYGREPLGLMNYSEVCDETKIGKKNCW
jgi:hypothetical protein